jgi:nitrate reductase gamma subunit
MTHRVSRGTLLLMTVLVGLFAFSLALPARSTQAQVPPGTTEEEQECWDCHRQSNLAGLSGALTNIALCLDCHADPQVDEWAQSGRTPLYVEADAYAETLHGRIACIACHTDLARNPHQANETVACADCHAAILAHVNMGAPHLTSDCAACHREDLPVVRDVETGRVTLASTDASNALVDRTEHTVAAEPGCDKCHHPGNDVGAPASILPARSILCMACHDASPTVSINFLDRTQVRTDWATLIGLLVFGVGMVFNVSLYLGGEIPNQPGLTTMQKLSYLVEDGVRLIFSRRIFRFVWGVIVDGIFLRRVLRESVGRWVMHTLIFLPFLARFGLGLLTWMGQALWPSAAWTQTLSNKNTPGVAFTYDFLTLLMILGLLFALFRRLVWRDRRLVTFAQDKAAISLLGGIILVGILTEGIRLLSAETPKELAVYSFLGYAVAAVLRWLNLRWDLVYPVIWYVHAVLAVAFVAYLPFSKFMHILAGPLIASLDTARKGSH